MKKVLSGIVLASILAIIVVPVISNATTTTGALPSTCKMRHSITVGTETCDSGSDYSMNDYPMCCLLDSIMTITDWIFYILIVIVVLFVVIGGFMFITSAGNPDKVKSARMLLIYAAIGLAIAVLARVLPGLVRFLIGA